MNLKITKNWSSKCRRRVSLLLSHVQMFLSDEETCSNLSEGQNDTSHRVWRLIQSTKCFCPACRTTCVNICNIYSLICMCPNMSSYSDSSCQDAHPHFCGHRATSWAKCQESEMRCAAYYLSSGFVLLFYCWFKPAPSESMQEFQLCTALFCKAYYSLLSSCIMQQIVQTVCHCVTELNEEFPPQHEIQALSQLTPLYQASFDANEDRDCF